MVVEGEGGGRSVFEKGKKVIGEGKALCNHEDAPAVARTNWIGRGNVPLQLPLLGGLGEPLEKERKKDGEEYAVKRINRFNWVATESGQQARRRASITQTKYWSIK